MATRTHTKHSSKSNGIPAHPLTGQTAAELQPFGTVVRLPIGLSQKACETSVDNLNQVLADSIVLRDLYKKCHWHVSGHTFYQLHLLFDKHFTEQAELIDAIAERIQLLGGVSLAMGAHCAEVSGIEDPPRGREEVPVMLSRLLDAHEVILKEAHPMASQATSAGDDGTNDLLVSDVIRTNELQVWFVSQHLVNTPPVMASHTDGPQKTDSNF